MDSISRNENEYIRIDGVDPFFVAAFDTINHPIKKAKKAIQTGYLTALTYIVEKALVEEELSENPLYSACDIKSYTSENKSTQQFVLVLRSVLQKSISEKMQLRIDIKQIVSKRLQQYQNQLFTGDVKVNIDEKRGLSCLSTFAKPWRTKYRFMLVCDVALILLDEPLVLRATELIKECLSAKQQVDVERVYSLLQSKQEVEEKYRPILPLLNQYRANKDFFHKEERRIIVTANMSAGKSTLINALVGKSIAQTSQEVCTGNVCYLFNKAYEDNHIHLSTQGLNLNATAGDLHAYDWNGKISIASYFTGIMSDIPRLCIIDTPGVDAALHKDHSKRARNALLNDDYDTIIYVVSPTRLGTDAEKKHLQWVAQNLQKEKIIFVLNKLDNYHDFSDSIEESICGFKEDLLKIGFEKPVICPLSAYFAYLLKLKMTGQPLSEDEEDEYVLYSKKFKKSSYDLSNYYEGVRCLNTDSEEIALSKRVGLYGLEKIIYGGRL